MADKKLGEARTQFVEMVSKAVISSVLDDLLEKGVLNDEEVEKVKKKYVTQEQARTLIDGVRKKGSKASLVAIRSIHARDAFLAEQLGLTDFLEGSPSQSLQALGSRAILSVEETQPVESRQGIRIYSPKVSKETPPMESRQGIRIYSPKVSKETPPMESRQGSKIYSLNVSKETQPVESGQGIRIYSLNVSKETQPVESGQGIRIYSPNVSKETQPVESGQWIKLSSPNVSKETQPVESGQWIKLSSPNVSKETQPVESGQGIKLCPQNVFDKIQKEEPTKIYPIRDLKTRTRFAIIICNIDFESDCFSRREGADVDLAGMKRLLTGLGYEVEGHTNLCSEGMADRLRKFAARKEHKTSDSTFVVLMSHGLRAGLCGVKSKGENSDILSHDTIYSILNNRNCPDLLNKPKVIIIQACRGENKGVIYVSCADAPSADSLSRVPRLPAMYESDALRRVHVESDLICFCSTTPDNVSWRSPTTGSIFIVQLIKHMQEHAWCYHLEDIFREVQLAFSNNPLQMPTRERATLLRKFYLFPGY